MAMTPSRSASLDRLKEDSRLFGFDCFQHQDIVGWLEQWLADNVRPFLHCPRLAFEEVSAQASPFDLVAVGVSRRRFGNLARVAGAVLRAAAGDVAQALL